MEGGTQSGGLCQNTPSERPQPADSPGFKGAMEKLEAGDYPEASAITELQTRLDQNKH